jgi:hypothetical protein
MKLDSIIKTNKDNSSNEPNTKNFEYVTKFEETVDDLNKLNKDEDENESENNPYAIINNNITYTTNFKRCSSENKDENLFTSRNNYMEYEIYNNNSIKINDRDKEVKTKEKQEKESKLNNTPDSIVTSVINKFLERSKIGKEKYGTDLDRTDLSLYEWILHAQEEHMDAILYLEKIKKLIVKT